MKRHAFVKRLAAYNDSGHLKCHSDDEGEVAEVPEIRFLGVGESQSFWRCIFDTAVIDMRVMEREARVSENPRDKKRDDRQHHLTVGMRRRSSQLDEDRQGNGGDRQCRDEQQKWAGRIIAFGMLAKPAIADIHGLRIEVGDNEPGLRMTLIFPKCSA